MEKNMKNSTGSGEKHEDDDDLKTRGTAMANSRPAKRRKVEDEEVNLSSSISQLTSPRRFVTSPEDSSVLEIGDSKDHFSGGNSDEVLASCCSSNRSSEDESDEIDYGFRRQSNETTPSKDIRSESGELESTEMPLKSHQQKPVEKSSVSRAKFEAELEEFFTAGEKQHLKQFSNKYNFDFENEKPLEGRFEWVKLNQ